MRIGPLRLVSRNAGMKLIITSLFKAMPSVSNVLGVVLAEKLGEARAARGDGLGDDELGQRAAHVDAQNARLPHLLHVPLRRGRLDRPRGPLPARRACPLHLCQRVLERFLVRLLHIRE